jgi:hypothetical protein
LGLLFSFVFVSILGAILLILGASLSGKISAELVSSLSELSTRILLHNLNPAELANNLQKLTAAAASSQVHVAFSSSFSMCLIVFYSQTLFRASAANLQISPRFGLPSRLFVADLAQGSVLRNCRNCGSFAGAPLAHIR